MQMPLHHLPKNPLPTTLNHIPMTRNYFIKIPAINPLHTLREPLPVLGTRHIPQEPALPLRIALRIHQTDEKPRQHSRLGAILGPRVLLVRRQVEDQVRFDERLVGLVAEDELLVAVAADVFVVEFAVEIRVDAGVEFVLLGPDGVELGAGGLAALLALFGKAFHPEEFGGWEGFRPLGDEDVVFEVESGDVSDVVAQLLDCGAHFVRQGSWGENCESAILEAD